MFHDHLGFHRTVSIARHAGGAWPEWYGENNRQATDLMTPELVAWLCEGADVLLSFETWYGEFVPGMAKQLGVKTALMPMYECCQLSGNGMEKTDLAICVSGLDLEEAEKSPGFANAAKVFIQVPFDTARIPYRQRTTAKTFLHNAGHGGIMGRNSTREVVEAWRYVKSPAKLILRMQPGIDLPPAIPEDPRITVFEGNPENFWELWDSGDVLLYPHKWDGLSLPIQEAIAAGLPVATTQYWPFCDVGEKRGWLPQSIQAMAIDPARTVARHICRPIDSFEVTPQAIAARVDALYGQSIEQASADARAYAELYSWDNALPQYEQIFSDLMDKT